MTQNVTCWGFAAQTSVRKLNVEWVACWNDKHDFVVLPH